jgi:diguanylate cyclase (GGDEF)-like protein
LTYEELLSAHEKLSRRLTKIVRRSDTQAQRLYELNEKLQEMAYLDYMTGIHNRRYFFENSKKMISFAKRKKHTLSLAMIDIDKFKNINDTYGHDIGDEVIKVVANTVVGRLRDSDLFARFGGEEFILMFPDTKLSDAIKIVNRIREDISNCIVNKDISFTISAGVVEMDLENETLEEVIKNSDEYLYKAKQNGRNRVESKNINL